MPSENIHGGTCISNNRESILIGKKEKDTPD